MVAIQRGDATGSGITPAMSPMLIFVKRLLRNQSPTVIRNSASHRSGWRIPRAPAVVAALACESAVDRPASYQLASSDDAFMGADIPRNAIERTGRFA